MCSPTSIGVHDDLTSGQTGVAHRTADDKVAARIDVIDGVVVLKVCKIRSLALVMPLKVL